MRNKTLVHFWLMFVPSVFLFYAGLWLSINIRYEHGLSVAQTALHFKVFTLLFVAWVVVFFIHGLYDIYILRRYTGIIFNLISAFVTNAVLSVIYFYFQRRLILTPRGFLVLDIAISFGLVTLWYLFLKILVSKRFVEGLYLFSPNNELSDLEKEIQGHLYLGYRVWGHLNDQNIAQARVESNSSVILPDNPQAKPEALSAFYRLRTQGVSFYNHRDFYENLLRRVYLSELSELWFLENVSYKQRRLYQLVKRIIDVMAGFIVLLVFLITFPIVALLIVLESRGPVLFGQERVGQNGKVFKIYKYRTMNVIQSNVWTEKNDKRITRAGHILRKMRIDELPQGINLLRGDLSLVGPRPEQVGIVEKLRQQIPFYDERHFVKPGITGWAQLNVYAGSLEETKLKLQYDLYYIKHRSLLFDLEIILKTAYYIFTWQGR